MQYKQVSVAGDLTVPVPLGLSGDEEAKYAASRVAFVDLEQLKPIPSRFSPPGKKAK